MKKVELVEEDDDEEENFLSEEEELGEEDSEKITAQTETENDLSGKEYLKAEQERELKFEEEEKRREQVADKTDYGQRERVRQVLPPVFVKEFRRSSLAQMRSLSRELSTSGGDEKDEAVRGGNRKLSICPEMTLSNADIKMKKGVVTSLTGFVDKIYEAGVHRITERMTERRVTGWKQVCKGLANDLAEALKQRTLVTDMDSRRKRFTALATAQLQEIEIATAAARTAKLAAAEGSHADNPSVTDADPQAERPSSSQLDSRPASSSHVSLAFERSQRLPSIDRAASSSEKHDRGEYLDSTSLDGVAGECVENSREVASCDSEETGDGFLEDYTPAMREISKYEAHASKLIETQTLPISHEFDSDEGNVNLLGAKSFWLERYAQLVKEKRDDEERIYRANVKSYDPSSSRFFFNVGHPLSREERIAMLKATVKERRDNMTM
ncbi:unnamed protein product [Symbiodinium microadriaticum]|nr:unnamed protein product [Symbiodinium microadriaticum]